MIKQIIALSLCLAVGQIYADSSIDSANVNAPQTSVKRSAGLHPFGVDFYKDPNVPCYPYANPNAPQGGELTLGWSSTFTNKNPMAIGGAPLPGYWLCFETLGESSFMPEDGLSSHGLLAEWFEIPDHHRYMTVKVRDNAFFSDGKPVTADDVVFSWNITADPGYDPQVRLTLKQVSSVEKIDEKTVRFHFSSWGRELPITLAGSMYIFPRHVYGRPGTSFGKDFTDMNPVGSGPYVVEKDNPSAFVTWKKNTAYWGQNLWFKRGRYNFERVTFKIFSEPRAQREAVKAGQIDFDDISGARDWATEFNIPHVQNNLLVKESIPNAKTPRLQCFAFNLRKPVFQDIRVRKAIESVFDFQSLNRNFFYEAYSRQTNFYMCPHLKTEGPPKDTELAFMLDLRKRHNRPSEGKIFVPKESITSGHRLTDCDVRGNPVPLDVRIKLAETYLDQAGWIYDPVAKVRTKDGVILRFEFLLTSEGFARLTTPFTENLERIGVRTAIKMAQLPEFQERVDKYDYDMIVTTFFPSSCPGVELNYDWSSTAARVKAGRNFCGVENPALDELISRIELGKSPEEVYFYAKIFDRILWSHYYFIPQWYSSSDRVVYWNKFGNTGVYFGEAYGTYNAYNFWWLDQEREAELKNALRANGKMNAPPLMQLPKVKEAK